MCVFHNVKNGQIGMVVPLMFVVCYSAVFICFKHFDLEPCTHEHEHIKLVGGKTDTFS